MRTKTIDQLTKEIRRLKRENETLLKEKQDLKKANIALDRDLKASVKRYDKLVKDIKRVYPTFTII